jgi:hypothetical protein
MISASSCQEFAKHLKALSQEPGISDNRAFLLKNIAKTCTGLSSQLDRLAELARKEK